MIVNGDEWRAAGIGGKPEEYKARSQRSHGVLCMVQYCTEVVVWALLGDLGRFALLYK
jgi:hypothetical protein